MGKKSEEKLGKKAKKQKKAEKKIKKAEKKISAAAPAVTPEQRIDMISTAAYYLAERHGFTPGMEEADWHAAEQQVDAMLNADR